MSNIEESTQPANANATRPTREEIVKKYEHMNDEDANREMKKDSLQILQYIIDNNSSTNESSTTTYQPSSHEQEAKQCLVNIINYTPPINLSAEQTN